MKFDPKPDVPCWAEVDRGDVHTGGGVWRWRVTVRTAPFVSPPRKRVYFIDAFSDSLAAFEGIRRFVEEAKQQGPPLLLRTVH